MAEEGSRQAPENATREELLREVESLRRRLAFLEGGASSGILDALRDHNAVIIAVEPESLRIADANRAAERFYGYPRDVLLSMRIPDINTLPEAEIRAEIRNAQEEGRCFYAFGHRLANGERRAVEVRSNIVSFPRGDFLVSIITDVTERKRIEEEARERDFWLRESQKVARIGSYTVDLAARQWTSTETMDEIFGIPPDYPKTQEGWLALVTDDQREAVREYFLGLLARNEDLFDREYPIRRVNDGVNRWIHGWGVFVRDARGVPVKLVGTNMDVTERKLAEDAIRASEEKFSKAFHHAPMLITISTLEDGRYIDVNEMFLETSGFRREEAVGRTSVELGWVSAADSERLRDAVRANGRVQNMELELTARDGRKVRCLYNGDVITVDGKKALLSIALDVTETARMQEQLVRTQKLESLGVLAGGLAHDFNNILTGILGNISFARAMIGEGHRAYGRLSECETAVARASGLTRQLLTFARGGEPVRKPVETGGLLREAVSFALRGSGVRGGLELEEGLWRLDADEGQMTQMLNNLLINARQAMPAGGSVTVSARNATLAPENGCSLPPGRYVRIVIRDEGEGIPPEFLPKIFDPYFTTRPGGTGLGLASVHSIVKRHGGFVGCRSTPGAGTAFEIHLPAAPEDAGDPGARGDEPVPSPAAGGRLLVMDDEEAIRNLAAMILAEYGCRVETSPDGADAVERYREALERGEPFDAVILDLTVPGGMGGKEAAGRILAIDPGAVLIVSSGYSNDPVVADHRGHGFSGAVAKPYRIDNLVAEVGRLLRR